MLEVEDVRNGLLPVHVLLPFSGDLFLHLLVPVLWVLSQHLQLGFPIPKVALRPLELLDGQLECGNMRLELLNVVEGRPSTLTFA